MAGANSSYGFGIGGETYVASLVGADLLFVTFAIWRYRSGRRPASVSQKEKPPAERGEQPRDGDLGQSAARNVHAVR